MHFQDTRSPRLPDLAGGPRYTLVMSDWKLVAAGRGFNLTSEELERISPVLDALESALRSQASAIGLMIEPAVTFQCAAEEQDS